MYTLKKILIPTDFSDGALHAAEYGMALAERLGASVMLLHAQPLPVYAMPDGGMLLPRPEDLVASTEKAQRALAAFRERLGPRPVEVALQWVEGAAAETIVRAAHDGRYDMVVMGTHGRTGLAHLLLGSVAERVVRTAECPVLTVRQPAAKS